MLVPFYSSFLLHAGHHVGCNVTCHLAARGLREVIDCLYISLLPAPKWRQLKLLVQDYIITC
jgi:hypothetical protein